MTPLYISVNGLVALVAARKKLASSETNERGHLPMVSTQDTDVAEKFGHFPEIGSMFLSVLSTRRLPGESVAL